MSTDTRTADMFYFFGILGAALGALGGSIALVFQRRARQRRKVRVQPISENKP